jgi:hypothetical protein
MNSKVLIVTLAIAFLLASRLGAVTVLSNYPGADYLGAFGNSTTGLSPSTWRAVGMGTGADPVVFSTITGYIENVDLSTSHSLAGGIYSDTSGTPGALLASFASQTVGAGAVGPVSLTTDSPYTLAANTNYWFVLSDPPLSGLHWLIDDGNGSVGTVPTTASGYSLLGYLATSNSGSSWTTDTLNHNVAIDVVVAPEPSRAILMLAGLSVLGLRRRRR